jgi:hypothetical protein
MVKCFGLGVFAGSFFVDIGNVYVTGLIDRWIGLGIAFRSSIITALLLSLFAGLLFREGSRNSKAAPSCVRALLFGLALVAGYFAIALAASLALLHFSIELPLTLALVPFLVICYFVPRLAR